MNLKIYWKSVFILIFLANVVQGIPRSTNSNIKTSARVLIRSEGNSNLRDSLINAGIDVLHQSAYENNFEVILTPSQFDKFSNSQIKFQLIERGRPLNEIMKEIIKERQLPTTGNLPRKPTSNYKNLAEIEAFLDKVQQDFPEIAKVVDLTDAYGMPATAEGRHIKALKISDNVNTKEDEFSMLLVSAHHSRELGTPVIALNAIEKLTSSYGSDPAVKELINNYEIWIAPIWNPDGYNYVFTTDDFWRKNRRQLSGGSFGVDLNRNYPTGWGDCGGSTQESSESFKGPTAASEAETKTMLAFTEAEQFIKVLDFHNFGQFTMWGYSSCSPHPFSDWLESQASLLGDEAGYSEVVEAGNMGLHFHYQTNRGAWSSIMETELSFRPDYDDAVAEAEKLWNSIKFMLEKPVSVYGKVRDARGNPLSARVELVGVNFPRNDTFTSGGPFGRYQLMLPPGNYNLRFIHDNYPSKDTSIVITENESQNVDIYLFNEGEVNVNQPASEIHSVLFLNQHLKSSTTKIWVYSLGGKPLLSFQRNENRQITWRIHSSQVQSLARGMYILKTDLGEEKKFIHP